MSFPHTLGLAEALRVMGVKGGQIPRLSDAMVPVVVLGDFSRSYSAEPFESRGISGARTTYPNLTRALFRVQSRSRGGIVVEDIRVNNAAGALGAQYCFVDILDSPPAGATEFPLVVVQHGNPALPAQSRVFQGDLPAAYVPTGTGPIDFSGLIIGTNPVSMLARFYIPPGRHLVLVGENTNGGQLQSVVTFREIPEPVGAP